MATKKTTQAEIPEEESTGEETTTPTITTLAGPAPLAMSKNTLTPKRRKIGNILHFIEAGQTVGSAEVDEKFDPSAESVTAESWQWLGNAEEVTPTTETEDDPVRVFKIGRGWVEEKNTEASVDSLQFTLLEISQIVTELQYRTGRMVDGTPAKPYSTSEVGKKGWLKVEKYDNKSNLLMTMYAWGTLKLGGDATENHQLTKPQLVHEIEYAEHNALTPDNGYGYSS